ncbi:hypothetical protein GE21DRAFT_5267 [Neurospora crassa]|uniref:Uncharacterized protein n=2 Tax=Neurospora crassa TaxID=5141 RepID=Q7SAZ5_NEUCR|nr:hypothetical protein NCU07630 [Neurospora crassa OR74A]EAA33569.1 hypothetical protein NCU07630 [Neurospora crassa OR74A]KHE84228.1 hypothetical protein GE21DRAFT_5267 [Neurospora crassa]CAE85489.1 hypothetical protein [Neurospora crassa]|eukprot:XP_962805.1 hypothetical protein NCU07630 [Neurospora crassa OR74A]
MSQTAETMATTTTTPVSTIVTSSLIKIINHQAQTSATASHLPAATPTPFLPEPYASAFSFFSSLVTIFYFFVVTFPAAIVGIVAIYTWKRRCREKAAAKKQQDIERAETRTFRFQLVQEARQTRECLEKIETKINAGGVVEGKVNLKEALVTVVEAFKEGREVEGMRNRKARKERKELRDGFHKIELKLDGFFDCIPKAAGEKKKKNRRKYRTYPALGPGFQGRDNTPAWGSASTTELEGLLDADGSVEGKEDHDYEADREESVYDEDDARSTSTVSSISTPEYSGEWELPDKQILVEMEDWNWKPVNVNDW